MKLHGATIMEEIAAIKTYAKKNSIPIMRDGGIDFICQYIKDHNIKRILEIGTAIGFSASEFAKVSPDVTVTTIELDIDRHITAKQNFSYAIQFLIMLIQSIK